MTGVQQDEVLRIGREGVLLAGFNGQFLLADHLLGERYNRHACAVQFCRYRRVYRVFVQLTGTTHRAKGAVGLASHCLLDAGSGGNAHPGPPAWTAEHTHGAAESMPAAIPLRASRASGFHKDIGLNELFVFQGDCFQTAVRVLYLAGAGHHPELHTLF